MLIFFRLFFLVLTSHSFYTQILINRSSSLPISDKYAYGFSMPLAGGQSAPVAAVNFYAKTEEIRTSWMNAVAAALYVSYTLSSIFCNFFTL
ncbi:unnamed protein product [Protopolystoma xenopodis]|uniref:PH domain-containing protein n=1 Tax=Protopolystoma xenopodis TaxID=117903 RepID=A0A3S4ZHN5_9PLAT|nr:unnamed protein product [Protopolystoma xenopodis]